jgi:hypothetical protein
MELQNYQTITTPDAMNAIPDQSTPYPLAIGSQHLTLLNDVRTNLIASGLPHSFLLGRSCLSATPPASARTSSTHSTTGVSPRFAWTNKQVSYDHLQPFGALCYYREHLQTDKLGPRWKKGRLMGYDSPTGSYRVDDFLQPGRVLTTRDLIFAPHHEAGEIEPKDLPMELLVDPMLRLAGLGT